MNIYLVIISGFTLRIIVSFVNMIYATPGSQGDADRFHNCGAVIAGYFRSERILKDCHHYYYPFDEIFSEFYVQILRFMYTYVGDIKFFGNLLSTILWLLAAIVLLKILKKLNINKKFIFIAIVLFSFFPSNVFLTSITLRESLQLLLINLSILNTIKLLTERKIKNLFFLIITLSFLNLFHHQFIYFAFAFSITIALFIYLKIRVYSKLILLLTSIFLLFFFQFDFSETSMSLLETIYSYRTGSIGGSVQSINIHHPEFHPKNMNYSEIAYSRAQYFFSDDKSVLINIVFQTRDSIFKFIAYDLPYLFFLYHLEPLIFVRNLIFYDYLIIIENFIRVILIILAVANLFFIKKPEKSLFFSLLVLFFCIESMFAVGTTNWGTAARHHIVTSGLIVILAFFTSKFNKKINE